MTCHYFIGCWQFEKKNHFAAACFVQQEHILLRMSSELSSGMDITGSCVCERVQFAAKGPIMFSCFCHCRSCCRGRAASPVHLLGIKTEFFTVTKGADLIEEKAGVGTLKHCICSSCGSQIHQQVADSYRALSPVLFKFETPDDTSSTGVSCKLPEHLLPRMHINYESRLLDCHDALPKHRGLPGKSDQLNNDGSAKK